MIKQYRDHTANERTYLAWIRTAITIMAFGILIEKIDLFFLYIGKKSGMMIFFKLQSLPGIQGDGR